MIQAIDICKSFEGRLVLDHVSATFQPGKTNLIIGQSGSGKTVLLKSLVGLHQIDSGQILYDKLCFSGAPLEVKREIRQKLGMIFQGGALLDSSTVIDRRARRKTGRTFACSASTSPTPTTSTRRS